MGRTHELQIRARMSAGRRPLELRGAGASGRRVCNNDDDNNVRKRVRNGEANEVDVTDSINPQFDPGPVGMQVQLCVNLQRRERCVGQILR
jgi:hypothetical protein